MSNLEKVREALVQANTLLPLLTVRQVIEGGDAAIDASGLNPYCMNEGLATGDEHIDAWRIPAALAALTAHEQEVAALVEILTAICDMQARNYGNGIDTHLELFGLASKARAALRPFTGDEK